MNAFFRAFFSPSSEKAPSKPEKASHDSQRKIALQPAQHGTLRVVIRWSLLGVGETDETIQEPKDAITNAAFISRLFAKLDQQVRDQLRQLPVARTSDNPDIGYKLATNPEREFLNPNTQIAFAYRPVQGTPFYLFKHTDHRKKVEDIKRLARRLGFPSGSIDVG